MDLNFFAKNKYNLLTEASKSEDSPDALQERFINENFKVYPIMIAVAKGEVDMIELLL